MSKRPPTPAAHYTARTMLLVLLITSGIAVSVSLAGNSTLGLQVCGGGLLLALVVLILGGLAVASSRPRDGEHPE